jgi:hypothetical protein
MTTTADDCAELESMAHWFDRKGAAANARRCRSVADKLRRIEQMVEADDIGSRLARDIREILA